MITCPYCLSPIGQEEKTVVCTSCRVAHHAECWNENGGCAAKGCAPSPSLEILVSPDEDNHRLVLTRESVEIARPRRRTKIANPCLQCGKEVPDGALYCLECKPEGEGNQDVRNLGPMLLMLALLGVVLAWFIVLLVAPKTDYSQPTPVRTETRTDR